jgi:hypothetical protein
MQPKLIITVTTLGGCIHRNEALLTHLRQERNRFQIYSEVRCDKGASIETVGRIGPTLGRPWPTEPEKLVDVQIVATAELSQDVPVPQCER